MSAAIGGMFGRRMFPKLFPKPPREEGVGGKLFALNNLRA